MTYTAQVTCTCSSTLCDYAESLKLVILVVFLFQVIENCKSALSEKMDEPGLRAVICHLTLKSLSPMEVHKDMVVTLGEGAPSCSVVKKWAAEFRHGRESLEDDLHAGRLDTITTQETIDKVHDVI